MRTISSIHARDRRPRRRWSPSSAVAADGWWAEIVAKAVLIGGLGVDAGDGFAALLVTVAADGTVEYDPRLAALAQ